MADSFRQNNLISHILFFLGCLLLVLALANDVCASPIAVRTPDARTYNWKRVAPIVVTSATGESPEVINPATRQVIAQGSGSDGGGTDFSLPSVIWLAFVFVIGIPIAFAGIRLWLVTTGIAIGLASALGVWAAFVNSSSANGLPDIVLTVIAIVGFAVGFAFGALKFGRLLGILVLGLLGGLSIGFRVVLLRPGLLIPIYIVNWLVLAIFMVLGVFAVLYKQRFGLVSSCAAIGTFLIGLGVDLGLQKQAGMSFALRFLLDRNNSHFLAIVHKGYNPTLLTQIILGASIGVTPVLAFGQHKIFKGPFRPKSPTDDTASVVESEFGVSMQETTKTPSPFSRMALLKSRFSTS